MAVPRVLVVSQYRSTSVGGAERYVEEVGARITRMGLKVTYVSSEDAGWGALLSPPWRVLSTGFHPAWFWQVDEVLDAIRPDVIYAHLTVPGLPELVISRAARRGIPVCAMYHSEVTGPDLLRRGLGSLYRATVGNATLKRVIVLCVASKAYVDASPALRAYQGAICFALPGVAKAFSGARRVAGTPYLLFVGKAAVMSKGFDVLYRAWLRLRKARPELGLTVAGAAPMAGYPEVRFLGQIKDIGQLADLYASAEVTVLPSTSFAESFGMVLAEALVAGCPIVTTDVGAGSDLVEPGRNGYLVPAGDVSVLNDAISQSLKNQEVLREYISSNRSAYMNRFNWDKTAEKTAAILHSVARSNPSAP